MQHFCVLFQFQSKNEIVEGAVHLWRIVIHTSTTGPLPPLVDSHDEDLPVFASPMNALYNNYQSTRWTIRLLAYKIMIYSDGKWLHQINWNYTKKIQSPVK